MLIRTILATATTAALVACTILLLLSSGGEARILTVDFYSFGGNKTSISTLNSNCDSIVDTIPYQNLTVPTIHCAFQLIQKHDTVRLLNQTYSGILNTEVRFPVTLFDLPTTMPTPTPTRSPGLSPIPTATPSQVPTHVPTTTLKPTTYFQGKANYMVSVVGVDYFLNTSDSLVLDGQSVIDCGYNNLTQVPADDSLQGYAESAWIFAADVVSSIKNVAFTRCQGAITGGALRFESSGYNGQPVTLSNVAFLSNSANFGGALSMLSTNAIINGSIFKLNTASNNAGALHLTSSQVTINACDFAGNTAGYIAGGKIFGSSTGRGGAIFFDGELSSGQLSRQISIFDSKFSYNVAAFRGGAFYGTNGTIACNNTIFEMNSVQGGAVDICQTGRDCNLQGGGVSLIKMSAYFDRVRLHRNYILADSNVDSNLIHSEGGGIYVLGYAPERGYERHNEIIISNSEFTNNNCSNLGGGLYLVDVTIKIQSTRVSSNVAGLLNSNWLSTVAAGGGMYVSVTPSLVDVFSMTVEKGLFAHNSVILGDGGAVFITAVRNVLFDGVHFVNNTAYASYSDSSSGGAVNVRADTQVEFTNCTFERNYATPIFTVTPLTYSGEGGALFALDSVVKVAGCTFNENYAISGQFDGGASGGAILFEAVNNTSVIVDSTFTSNGASGFAISSFASSGSGGAVTLKFSAVVIDKCSFTNNWATVGGSDSSLGGAIAVFYTPVGCITNCNTTLTNNQFINNSAIGQSCNKSPGTGHGGALSIVGYGDGTHKSTNPNITVNTFLNVIECTFIGNVAFANDETLAISFGGAISNSLSSKILINNCTFHRNEAIRGIGHDINSISAATYIGDPTAYNQVAVEESFFLGLSEQDRSVNAMRAGNLLSLTCNIITLLVTQHIPSCSVCYPNSPNSMRRKLILPQGLYVANKIKNEDQESHRRSLSSIESLIGKVNIDVFTPYIIFADTLAVMVNNSVSGGYDIFLGDVNEVLPSTNPQSSDQDSLVSKLNFAGYLRTINSKTSGVTVRAYRALVVTKNSINDHEDSLSFSKLELIYSGLVIENNITVQNATLFGASILNSNLLSKSSGATFAPSAAPTAAITPKPTAQPSSAVPLPAITFAGTVTTYIDITNGNTGGFKIFVVLPTSRIENSTFLNVSYCQVNIAGNFSVSSNVLGQKMVMILVGNSKVHITGEFILNSPTWVYYYPLTVNNKVIYSPSFVNSKRGKISIAGLFPDELLIGKALPDPKKNLAGNSVDTPLHILGDFTNEGNIYFYLNQSSQFKPSLYLKYDSGLTNGNFYTEFSPYTNPSVCVQNYMQISAFDYLCPYASQWVLVEYLHRVSSSPVNLHIIPPKGLEIEVPSNDVPTAMPSIAPTSLTYSPTVSNAPTLVPVQNPTSAPNIVPKPTIAPSPSPSTSPTANSPTTAVPTPMPSVSTSYVQILKVQSMTCEAIAEYSPTLGLLAGSSSQSSNGWFCNLCVVQQASGCNYCLDGDDANSNSGQCVSSGSSCSGTAFRNTCCPNDCSNNGNCVYEDNIFQCKCNVFYHQADCGSLSIIATSLISVFSVFFVLTIIGYAFRRYNNYKLEMQLDELKEDLLNDDGDGTGMKGNKYIRDMRQDLILKDVMVKFEDIKIERKIGEGSFGVVYKAAFRGAQVALKQMRSMFVQLTDHDINEFKKEAYMMSRLRHPNIVLVMGISLMETEAPGKPVSKSANPIEDSDMPKMPGDDAAAAKSVSKKQICILTEYLEQGSLADILYGPTKLPAEIWSYELILTCALQTARGMLYLHSNSPPICHRDLKSSNLVVDDHWVVKVTDFGMSRIVPESVQDKDKGIDFDHNNNNNNNNSDARSETNSIVEGTMEVRSSEISVFDRSDNGKTEMTSNLGTTAWCAPELLTASSKTKYSIKVDVYSFGMVLWELWERKRPWDELNSRFDIIDAIRAGRRPAISDNCPPAFRSLMQRCWQQEPARRPNFQYIVRYLKDEHARVKRQNKFSGGGGVNNQLGQSDNYSDATSPPNYEDHLSGGYEDVGSSANSIPSLRDSIAARIMDTFSPKGNSNSRNNSNTSIQRGGNSNSNSNSNGKNSSSSDETSARSSIGGGNNKNNNNWRDKYVMKVSGWTASEPDSGLPPSMGGVSQRNSETVNPMLKSSSSSNGGDDVLDLSVRPTRPISVELDETSSPFPIDDIDKEPGFRDSNQSITSTRSITEMKTMRDLSNRSQNMDRNSS